MRIAATYALLNGAASITPDHINAGLAFGDMRSTAWRTFWKR